MQFVLINITHHKLHKFRVTPGRKSTVTTFFIALVALLASIAFLSFIIALFPILLIWLITSSSLMLVLRIESKSGRPAPHIQWSGQHQGSMPTPPFLSGIYRQSGLTQQLRRRLAGRSTGVPLDHAHSEKFETTLFISSFIIWLKPTFGSEVVKFAL